MEYDILSQIISRNMEIDIFQTLQMLYPTHFQEEFQNYLKAFTYVIQSLNKCKAEQTWELRRS